jgi:vesicle coat complex subunit
MRDHPLFFLSDFYLKYLGWSLNDKDPRVRLAVLAALRELYSASSENLALMDTFNARFILRVREMVNDVDAGVAAEAIGTLSVLHETGVLPREDMEPVLSLLLDGDEQIRHAAAAVIPSLITPDDDEAADKSDEDSSRATLLSVVHIIRAGLCKLNPVDVWLESARFQPLNLSSSENPVSTFGFKSNLCPLRQGASGQPRTHRQHCGRDLERLPLGGAVQVESSC